MVMVAVIIYLVLKNHNDPVHSRFSSPLHFTIPVLSPFTSVVSDCSLIIVHELRIDNVNSSQVEQETSVINAPMLAVISLFGAATVYGCFRYWLTHQRR